MIKQALAIAFAITASYAGAGSASAMFPSSNGAIITPDVATGFFQFYDEEFKTQPNGTVTVCFPDRVTGKQQCNTPMTEAVPPGKTFAGFRLAYGNSTRRFLEVYYK